MSQQTSDIENMISRIKQNNFESEVKQNLTQIVEQVKESLQQYNNLTVFEFLFELTQQTYQQSTETFAQLLFSIVPYILSIYLLKYSNQIQKPNENFDSSVMAIINEIYNQEIEFQNKRSDISDFSTKHLEQFGDLLQKYQDSVKPSSIKLQTNLLDKNLIIKVLITAFNRYLDIYSDNTIQAFLGFAMIACGKISQYAEIFQQNSLEFIIQQDQNIYLIHLSSEPLNQILYSLNYFKTFSKNTTSEVALHLIQQIQIKSCNENNFNTGDLSAALVELSENDFKNYEL